MSSCPAERSASGLMSNGHPRRSVWVMDCPLTNNGPCTERSCPFWLHGECLISEIDLGARPDVVAWLDDLRRELAARDLSRAGAGMFDAAVDAAGE